jgi:hypothetical protein
MTTQDVEARRVRASELLGNHWLNGAPMRLDECRGRVLLLLFLDSSCARSRRLVATAGAWRALYAECGLLAVGVHVPRFPFGRDPGPVGRALDELDPGFPVVMDNDALIASRYGVRALPALIVVDAEGYIRFRAEEEGHEEETEHVLHALLHEAGHCEDLPLPTSRAAQSGFRLRATPDLMTGYVRGSLGNVEGYSPESVVLYRDPTIYFDGRFYAAGEWLNGRTDLALTGPEGDIIANYQAMEAHAVLEQSGEPAEIVVRQDDAYLTEQTRGADVRIAPDGRSYVLVEGPRTYQLVRNPAHGQHILRLHAGRAGLRAYGIAFVSGMISESVMNN